MRENSISPHPVSLPFPLGNGVRVSSTKLSTAEELFQNQRNVCISFWSRSNLYCLFYKIVNMKYRIMQIQSNSVITS
jgi:hypothetical protein